MTHRSGTVRVIMGTAMVALALGLSAPAGAGEADGMAAHPPATATSIVFSPTGRGTPGTRIIGSVRGVAGSPLVAALTPPDTGETTLAQPTLHWFVSHPVEARVEITVVDERTQRTVLETTADGPVRPGIWAFPLGPHRVTLEPGVEYRWSVSLVRDPAQRSLDLFASGTILRVDLPQDLAARLNRSRPAELPYALAGAGLWYDALAILSAQIAADPADPAPRAARADLLRQVDLPEAAAFDGARG
ncbi:DUF928 domain-containing protein [Azospirillum halopraeferens]|uniref:DUF928 domain-containing protein n=1 Tax=Azospirillum halopraeferens TaxID=34010 RepID=UPI000A057868|nr:DUF928 domain-containing protein [Azospirillum halopraeferens]